MPKHLPNNLREPGSRITDSTILRKGDELELHGNLFIARIAILDSHDPQEKLRQITGQKLDALSNHHHVLLAPDPDDETGLPDIFTAGVHIGTGGAGDLFFNHYPVRRENDEEYMRNLDTLVALGKAGFSGMFYVSDHEALSSRDEARQYLDGSGNLLI